MGHFKWPVAAQDLICSRCCACFGHGIIAIVKFCLFKARALVLLGLLLCLRGTRSLQLWISSFNCWWGCGQHLGLISVLTTDSFGAMFVAHEVIWHPPLEQKMLSCRRKRLFGLQCLHSACPASCLVFASIWLQGDVKKSKLC